MATLTVTIAGEPFAVWRAVGEAEIDDLETKLRGLAASPARPPPSSRSQKCFGSPACFRISFAMWRLATPRETGNLILVTGLYQISWLPLPART